MTLCATVVTFVSDAFTRTVHATPALIFEMTTTKIAEDL
jgi:hypothetical protein